MSSKLLCYECRHFDRLGDGFTCRAFPNGIPDVIAIGDNNHETPLEKQGNAIVFEPLQKEGANVIPLPQKSYSEIMNLADALRKAIRIDVD